MGELQALDQTIRDLQADLAQERVIADVLAMAIGMRRSEEKAVIVKAALEAWRIRRSPKPQEERP